MSKLVSLEFAALNVSGDNYLQWALDTRINLMSKGLGDTITGAEEDEQKNFKAIATIRHHLHESLKNQYLTIDCPHELWTALKSRYDHHKTVLLPKAQFEWKNLRFQDFKSVDDYNSALFRIVSTMRLCGEKVTEKELLEKTLSTFHSTNVVIQQQYRERKFKTYADLIACLLLAQANNELLMRNSELRSPGTAPLPDISKLALEPKKESHLVQHNNQPGPSRGRGYGRGRGTFKAHGRGRGRGTSPGFSRGQGRGRSVSFKPQKKTDLCHRCGMGNHWAKNCRTPKHLCELYMESLKKNPEAHMVHDAGYEADGEGDMDYVQGDPIETENHEKVDHMEYETSDILK